MTPAHPPSRSTERELDPGDAADLPTLGDAADLPLERVGGKARTLERLRREELPVPEGLVLPADLLAGAVDSPDEDDTSPAASLPRAVRGAVAAAFEALSPSPIAVRSSGAAEDGSVASYAGQFETVLDVTELEALEEAVRRCCTAPPTPSTWTATVGPGTDPTPPVRPRSP